MKTNKSLLFGTVLAATGIAALAGSSEAKASEQYTVQSGDTLFKISRQFTGGNGFVDEIVAANNIQNRDMIFAGQVITIPTEEEAKANAQQAQAQTPAVAPVQQTQPVQETKQVQQTQPVQETKQVQQTQQQTNTNANKQNTNQNSSSLSSSEEAAKNWIAMKESTNNYNARNGRYIGKYQLDSSYLNGDYSPENQERVANNYVQSRYGSWANAKAFWQSNGWY